MGDGLQSAGHHMDAYVSLTCLPHGATDVTTSCVSAEVRSCVLSHGCRYAASIDDILEEEEHYADQLKEYLFYAEALR